MNEESNLGGASEEELRTTTLSPVDDPARAARLAGGSLDGHGAVTDPPSVIRRRLSDFVIEVEFSRSGGVPAAME